MKKRILHVGDIHIKEDWRCDDTLDVMDEIIGVLASRGGSDLVLVSGDVFDHASSPKERFFFKWFLDAVKLMTGAVVICRGNHDRPLDLSVFSGGNVYVFEEFADKVIEGVRVIAVPWADSRKSPVYLLEMLQRSENPGVLVGHLTVAGAEASSGQPIIGQDFEVPLGTLQDLVDTGVVQYVALGHIHKPQQFGDRIYYAGSTTIRDFGEQDEQKRVLWVEMDGDSVKVESINLDHWKWMTIEARVENGEVVETPGLSEMALLGDDITRTVVRYRYACTEAEADLFNHDEILERFGRAVRVKIVSEIERVERVRSTEIVAARTNEEKLRAWGEAVGVEITESMLRGLREIEEEEK